MVTSRYNPTAHTVDYTVFTSDEVTRGVFSKIAGVLAAKGLHVLSAQISTHRDGVVVDRFEVIDRDFREAPSEHRHREVADTIRRVLLGRETVHDTFLTHRRIEHRVVPQSAGRKPTQVHVDNDTSDRFTILDVFATDRQGLLYTITHTLVELDLTVGLAKIDTSLDQVLDVFYVTDLEGNQITHEDRLQQIRRRLVEVIEKFEQTGEFPSDG